MLRAAAQALEMTEAQAQANSEPIQGHDLVRFWSVTRGGGGIIIGPDLTYLLFGPLTTDEQALDAYLGGRRTQR